MRRRIRIAGSLFFALIVSGSCSSKTPRTNARQISSRADLIGGPGALGEVGDYLLANEQVRVIVQGTGYSRGFGLYGGSLIDADLQRPETYGDSSGGKGHDNFSELFPAIFLKAMRPNDNGITIKDDFPDGSASVIVRGKGAEFLFVAQRINELLFNAEDLIFQTEYHLAPGKRYVEIITTVINQGTSTVQFPGEGILSISDALEGFRLPVGDVLLFGAGNDVFSEGAGFDMRFTLERLYKDPPPLPRLPGLVTPFLATRGHMVSYGFMNGITDPELSFVTATGYPDVRPDSLVVPFIAASFTGAFMGAAPSRLEPRSSFSYKKYFIVGSGDVASIRDVVHELHGEATGTFGGFVREKRSQAPEAGVDVLTFNEQGGPYSQHTTDSRGFFRGSYAPGRYTYRVLAEGRFATDPVAFEIKEGTVTSAEIEIPPPGLVAVRVRDQNGRDMPAKCTLVGQYSKGGLGMDPKEFLYDLSIGEHMRPTDLIPDTDDPGTREYIEHYVFAPLGRKTDKVRPGKYRAVCSRGMEYDLVEQEIEVRSGEMVQVEAMLTHVLDTQGWASGDYHLHADPSVDSSLALEDRVAHCAIEGLDIACSSDHNFVTDYTPYIAKQGLESWVQGMVGLEMTTLEIGHFNGFPLNYDPGPITKGSFEWSGRPPEDLLNDLRALGKYGPENTIIQVNHPRDTILGYFNDYNFNPDTGEAENSDALLSPMGTEFGKDKFTYNFDALEIYNGKRYELLHSYRVPEVLPPPPIPPADQIPPAGTVLRDAEGKVAFPGGMEDWFAMLDKGHVYTAMANSDTHSLEDEPGIPRTYTPVSRDVPGGISEMEIITAIKNQRAMLTNGPFVRIELDGASCHDRAGNDLGRNKCGMGEVVTASGGNIGVHVKNDMAPWIDIDRVIIWRNGEAVRTREGDKTTLAAVDEMLPIDRDGYLIVEVIGSKSMWPVVSPLEVPSIQVSDALGSIAGAFGIEFNPFGNLSPSRVTVAYPYAFTNPIFIDFDGDGRYTAPGVQARALRAASDPRINIKKPRTVEVPALVRLFGAFSGHGH